VTCISFEEALKRAEVESAQGHPTLLLGNGFGIAYDANIFSYKALFKSVDWSNAERVQRVFEALKTWDFELAIRTTQDRRLAWAAAFTLDISHNRWTAPAP
jgi:hypothetical protein